MNTAKDCCLISSNGEEFQSLIVWGKKGMIIGGGPDK